MDNPERVTYFAATDSRGKRIPFGIKQKDRDRHMYVIGKTGMGKSTLLENMAIQDLRNGEGLVFIDPHGGTVDKLLDYIPEDRVKDVVYFAPFDMENPIAFNVMEDVGYDRRHLVVSGLMATFKKIWEDAWSARMEYILTNTLLALLEYPDATLLGVNRMYTDKDYRTKVVDNVKDPVVKDFWLKEFANYGDRYTQEATPAIQNKIGQFTGNPLIRNIIGQPKSSFDIRTMMDQRKILIINLSKGLVGETNMRLLGSMLTTRIFLAAMSRANLSGAEIAKLPHFYFYVDEFQNFANETFAEILSESRKYRLNLVIAHQYIEQMEEEVRDAVFGNVGTTIVFRVGPFDAEFLETVFMPKFTKEDIVNLGLRQIYLSLMIDGVGSPPFSASTIPPIEPPPKSFRKEVIAASRQQFSVPRSGVEKAIGDELAASLAAAAPPDARMRKRPQGPPSNRPQVRDTASAVAQTAPVEVASTLKAPAPNASPRNSDSPAQQFAATARPIAPNPAPAILRTQPRAERVSNVSPRSSGLPVNASQSGARPLAPHPTRAPETTVPASQSKSSEDLKSILRTMTSKAGKEKEVEQSKKQESLKGVLADVLAKNTPAPQAPTPIVVVVQNPAPAKVEEPKVSPPPSATVAPAPSVPEQPTPSEEPAPIPAPEAPTEKKPFEVPEAELRSILNGDK